MSNSPSPGASGEDARPAACEQCGTPHEAGQPFCDTCGAVLRWTPGGTARPAPHAAAGRSTAGPDADTADLPPATGRPAASDRMSDTAGTGRERTAGTAGTGGTAGSGATGDTAGSGAGAAEGPGPLPAPASGTASTSSGSAPSAGATDPAEDERARARALLVPVDDPQGEQERPSVAPVLPGQPVAARPQVRAPGEYRTVDGVACPWCGTPNRPDRHFCCRCAMRMASSPEGPARLPWWRRLFDRRNREQPWAGDRPRLRWQIGRVLRWLALAAVLTLVVIGLFQTDTAIQAIRDHFAKRALVSPESTTASASFAKHGPDQAFDPFSNTWWGPGVSPGTGNWLEARFSDPVRLLDIGITPGESSHAEALTKSAQPHRISAQITMDNGHVENRVLNLDQGSGFQHQSFRYGDVVKVRLTVDSAYGTGPDKQVAIAAVEFFGPSHSQG
ncbi:NADase-type glycan-binding domain-containing protein [Streptomyces benahoarensis]|uniref:Zinc ribbon domain-containing protein n=1 Tax=Streptomyces benahoarensis TaxID=2595054 RepID=A0A553ZCM0_9ACTN|nr:zinc ribbon domain-containing protein [Streptomyces benahoarensis]TSB24044.1 zinc ribbon domain-containing protein [Streptomyces benahoarensis]TSB39157.1 zinc ribbon domain-containing protein [Streptomyces benahoarensis]